MERVVFTLSPRGLTAVNDLNLFLNDLQRRAAIGAWRFGRHTDLSKLNMTVEFDTLADATCASQAWKGRHARSSR